MFGLREIKGMKEKGITLVALVITIVILLILAGISISTLTNTGIFQKAKDAKQKYENEQKNERSLISKYQKEIVRQDAEGKWDGKVNKPELMTGMRAIEFEEPTDTTEGSVKSVNDINTSDWYNYDEKKWANAQTEDGSMWVWIPRFAYKIIYNDSNDKSKGGIFDIVFLIGTTDNYIDDKGNLQTAQRQTDKNQVIETDSTKTNKYTVHPAFTNESNIDYQNGGWDKELTGIWVAKFEAGYASGNNKARVQESEILYSQNTVVVSGYEGYGQQHNDTARNWLDGEYSIKKGENLYEWKNKKQTKIKYPTFQGLTYSMNYISLNDAYLISKTLNGKNNIYRFKEKETDSHLMKSSEWGAIVYLTKSKYGLENRDILINNVTLNSDSTTPYAYAVTGCSGDSADSDEVGTTIEKIKNKQQAGIYTWTQLKGTGASTTGTIYGIYDTSGGLFERNAGRIEDINSDFLKQTGTALIEETANNKSTKYVTVYKKNEENSQSEEEKIASNYNVNNKYGDALKEISNVGVGQNAWNDDWFKYLFSDKAYILHGATYEYGKNAGIMAMACSDGNSFYSNGFRAVLVSK